jgi:hypothetical protein
MGRGKRIWFSGSIVAWLTIIPVFAVLWAVGWMLGGIAYLLVQGVRKALGK